MKITRWMTQERNYNTYNVSKIRRLFRFMKHKIEVKMLKYEIPF